MKSHALSSIYEHYKAKGGTLPKALFKNVVQDCNNLLVEQLLEGKTIYLPFGMSTLRIMRFKSKLGRKSVDHNASRLRKQELLAQGKTLFSKEAPYGEKWLVYHENRHTDNWVCKFHWDAKNVCHSRSKNHKNYRLYISRNEGSPKQRLAVMLKSDPSLILNFKPWRS